MKTTFLTRWLIPSISSLSARTTTSIYFVTKDPLVDVPNSLVNYGNSFADYDGPSGLVICSFESSIPSEKKFDVYYKLTNGKGGDIISRTPKAISVLFFLALKNQDI